MGKFTILDDKKSYLSQDQCKAVIKRLNKIFNRKVIIKFINGNGSSTAYHNEIVIRNNWGRSMSSTSRICSLYF